ncbi:hypothetical protein HAX54_021770 [Datura stramonium]|uniref:Uncharacterized protein n=1 Tax=Datura stramonium TaxID=4076 RepID=A0ABS8UVB1_DATST|nr:hypothetical protein [Datura stramonium]
MQCRMAYELERNAMSRASLIIILRALTKSRTRLVRPVQSTHDFRMSIGWFSASSLSLHYESYHGVTTRDALSYPEILHL